MYKEVFREQILKGGKAVLIQQKLYISGNEKCFNINTPSISRIFFKFKQHSINELRYTNLIWYYLSIREQSETFIFIHPAIRKRIVSGFTMADHPNVRQ